VIATKEYGLKIKLKLEEFDKSWTMTIFSNSDYAGDSNTQVSMTGYCIFLLGVPIVWKVRAKRV